LPSECSTSTDLSIFFQLLQQLVADDIKRGVIKPLQTNSFDAKDIEKAFRFLASGKHIGKIVLKVRDNKDDAASQPIQVIPRVYCKPELSYIIPGGLGGFGLELADWLVLRGCKKLVLSSSRGVTTSYQSFRIK
jgi:fatty acid synthase, animal type